MGYIEKTNKYNELIQFNKTGIVVSDYPEIRRSISNMMKDIYGQDIDLSTASADGIFVANISLLINNILQSIKELYNNLDVDNASGIYLDRLCSLTNVKRRDGVHSTCSLTITSNESESITVNELDFLDQNGNIWNWVGNENITLQPNVETPIIVTSIQSGPIQALRGTEENDYEDGYINQLLTTEYNLKIQQKEDAIIGTYGETDAQLRERRGSYLGLKGNSVLESLLGALIQLNGVEDVKIYNNDTGGTINTKTALTIPKGSVAIMIRKNENVTLEDSVIGTILYEKMTVGVHFATGSNSTSGTWKSYEYKQKFLGTEITGIPPQTVNWKECIKNTPTITITLTKNDNYVENSTYKIIAQNVINYLNDLFIGQDVIKSEMYNIIYNSDPRFRGKRTFELDPTNYFTIAGMQNDKYINPDTYFYYTLSMAAEEITNNIVTITIN